VGCGPIGGSPVMFDQYGGYSFGAPATYQLQPPPQPVRQQVQPRPQPVAVKPQPKPKPAEEAVAVNRVPVPTPEQLGIHLDDAATPPVAVPTPKELGIDLE
jgi:hypothetical protein